MSSQNWSKREGNFYIFFYSEENDLIQSRFASSKLAFSFLIESIWGSQWDAGCWDSRQEVDAVRFVISQDVLDGGGCMNNDSRSLDQNEKGEEDSISIRHTWPMLALVGCPPNKAEEICW